MPTPNKRPIGVKALSDYYTLAGAAEVLGVKIWNVKYFIRTRHIPTITLGKSVLVHLSDLRDLRH